MWLNIYILVTKLYLLIPLLAYTYFPITLPPTTIAVSLWSRAHPYEIAPLKRVYKGQMPRGDKWVANPLRSIAGMISRCSSYRPSLLLIELLCLGGVQLNLTNSFAEKRQPSDTKGEDAVSTIALESDLDESSTLRKLSSKVSARLNEAKLAGTTIRSIIKKTTIACVASLILGFIYSRGMDIPPIVS